MTKIQKIMVIGMAVVLLAVLVVGGIFLFKGEDPKPSPTPVPTVEPTPVPTVEPTLEPTPVPSPVPTLFPTPPPAATIKWIPVEDIKALLGIPFLSGGYDCTSIMTTSPEEVLELKAQHWYAFKFEPLYGANYDMWKFDGGAFLTNTAPIAESAGDNFIVETMPVQVVNGYNYVLIMPLMPNYDTAAIFNSYSFGEQIKTSASDTVIKIKIVE